MGLDCFIYAELHKRHTIFTRTCVGNEKGDKAGRSVTHPLTK